MQVSFNPYITNQQQIKQPTHKAVIQKYVDVAKKDVKTCGAILYPTLRNLWLDVAFEILAPIDAIDTLEKIKEFAPNRQNVINDYLQILRKNL